MNAKANTTTSAEHASFPIPFPHQLPHDDVTDATAMLQTVYELMSEGRIFGPDFVRQIAVLISLSIEKLGPVSVFLNHQDSKGDAERYGAARREWIKEHGGRP